MTFEAADRAALELVSRMTLHEKMDQMTGSGIAPMTLAMLLRGTTAPVYSGAHDRLGIPPVAFTDGPRGVPSATAAASAAPPRPGAAAARGPRRLRDESAAPAAPGAAGG